MSKTPNYDSLTPLQKRFVDEFIQNGGNQSKAYQDAGYTARTSSAVRSGASRLRNTPEIIEAIKERVQPDELKRMVKNKEIVEELLSIALGEQRIAIVEGEQYEMTPELSDQLNAIKIYDKMVSLSKETQKRIELLESQIKYSESRVGTNEEEEDRVGLDIWNLTAALEGDTDDDESN